MNGPKKSSKSRTTPVLTRERSKRTIKPSEETTQITQQNKSKPNKDLPILTSTPGSSEESQLSIVPESQLSFGQSLDLQTPSYTYQAPMDVDNDNSAPPKINLCGILNETLEGTTQCS